MELELFLEAPYLKDLFQVSGNFGKLLIFIGNAGLPWEIFGNPRALWGPLLKPSFYYVTLSSSFLIKIS